MTTVAESLQTREQFFRSADLRTSPGGCGDDRPCGEVQIGAFGGIVENVTSGLMVLQEAAEPGSVQQPFSEAVASLAPMLGEEGIDVIVHSDQKTEDGDTIDLSKDAENDLGCAYNKLRQAIFALAGERGGEITEKLTQLKPHRYGSDEGKARLQKFIPAFAALGKRDSLFTSGRDVARKLKEEYPDTRLVVVQGPHVASVGILDDRQDSLFDTQAAMEAGLPAYAHEGWASREAFEMVHDRYPYDKTDYEAVNDIDTIATMLALGLEDIQYRGA